MYAASLYPDGGAPSVELSVGEQDASGSTVTFMFEKPPLAEGERLTLEIFAFDKDTAKDDLLKDAALLTGTKSGLEAEGGRITIADPMTLTPNTAGNAPKGTVSLKVTVPDGCALELDDTTNFTVDSSIDYYTIKQKDGEGISAGTYTLTFKVTKNSETLHAFADTITVWPGMLTDTWSGLAAGEPLEVTEQKMSRTFYVRGNDPGWYSANGYSNSNYTPSDSNAGTFLAPFATIQKAINTVVAAGDDYTIYVDGTLTYGGLNANGMADFSALDKPLKLTIKALSTTEKATLDAGGKSRVMCASPAPGGSLDLTLERLVLTGGNSAVGGGIDTRGARVSLTDCDVTVNRAVNAGGIYTLDGASVTMSGGKISGNTGTDDCGGICVNAGCSFEMVGGEISGNTGSGALVLGTLKLDGMEVKDNTGTGISLFDNAGCEFEMTDGVTVSGNKGGGIYVGTGDKLTMTGGTIGGTTDSDKNTAQSGGGVYVNTNGAFDMTDGKITGNTATTSGAGVYMNTGGTFNMTGGTIMGNTAAREGGGVYVYDSSCMFTMGGSAKVAADNDVYLSGSGSSVAKIQVAGTLSATTPVATITPSSYAEDRQILSGSGITKTICAKFALTSEQWVIASDTIGGVLARNLDEIYLDSANGRDTNTGESASKAVKTLAKAVELFDKCRAQKVYVCAAYTLASGEKGLLNRSGKDRLTLVRYDGSSDVSVAFTGYLLTVSSGTVTLSNVTLDGNKDNVTASASLLRVSDSADVTLGDGATVCNNKNDYNFGGGVYVYGGTFTMTGGTISDNKSTSEGGGVANIGTFTMTGGEISRNTANAGGGVMVGTACMFTMTGGKISWNRSTSNKSISGGGVCILSAGTFTMEGGEISDNTAASSGGGVYVSNIGTFMQGTGIVTKNTPDDMYED